MLWIIYKTEFRIEIIYLIFFGDTRLYLKQWTKRELLKFFSWNRKRKTFRKFNFPNTLMRTCLRTTTYLLIIKQKPYKYSILIYFFCCEFDWRNQKKIFFSILTPRNLMSIYIELFSIAFRVNVIVNTKK